MTSENVKDSLKSKESSSVFFSAKSCDIDVELKNSIDSKMEPYSFLIKDDFGSAIRLDQAYIKNTRIQCPHFSALLDHTIAVLWGIFSKSQKGYEFRPAQITWAIRFLEGIKNKNGNLSVDISKAIERMEKFIFYKYGQMNESSLSTLIDSSLEMQKANMTNPKKNKVSFTLHEILGDSYDSVMESYNYNNSNTFLVKRESPKVKNRTFSIKENVPEKLGETFLVNEESDGKTFTVEKPASSNNENTFTVRSANRKNNTFSVACNTEPKSKNTTFLIHKKEINRNLKEFDSKVLRTNHIQIKEETFVINGKNKKKYFLGS